MDKQDGSAAFRALGEPVRLRILQLLASGEVCGCDLLESLTISQPTLSHHMKVLIDSGLVVARRRAVWVHYALRSEGFEALRRTIDELTAPGAKALEQSSGSCCSRKGRGT